MRKYIIEVYKKDNHYFAGYLVVHRTFATSTKYKDYCTKYKTWFFAKLECIHLLDKGYMHIYKIKHEQFNNSSKKSASFR
jgi:hypothetical protein